MRTRLAALRRDWFAWFVVHPPLRSRWAVAVTVAVGAVTVALIGLIDVKTSSQFSFAAVRLVPATIVTVLVSTRAGVALAIESALVSIITDHSLFRTTHPLPLMVNSTLRAVVVLFVVFLLGSLRHALEQAKAAEATSRNFLAAAAHQLRTPVAGAMVSAEALMLEEDPDRRILLKDNLVFAAERAGDILSALLQLARAGQLVVPALEPVDLIAFCRRELNAFESANNVGIILSGTGRVDALTAPAYFRSAFANIVDNAVRRCTSRVEVIVDTDGSSARILVCDDGPGIPPGSEEVIFDRFVQLDANGGSGLGLPVARALLRTLGGDVVVAQGGFLLTLPLAPERSPTPAPQPPLEVEA